MRFHRSLLLTLSCLAALRVQAQSDPPAIALPAEPMRPAEIDSIRVVGARRALNAVPGSASVVTASELRDGQRQVNLSESLQRVPGVTALDRQNYAQDLQIQSRGFGARSTFGIRGIRLIVDGIPASAADGQAQAAAFPLSSLDRIEVLRGPLALQYGNAAGGVILGISALQSAPGVSAEAWASDDGSRRASVRVDGGDDDQAWRWRASGSAFATDGVRPHSAARRTQFNAIGEWSRSEFEHLRVIYNGLRLPLAQDPLGLTRDAFDRDPEGTDPTAALFDTRKTVSEDQLGLQWRRDNDSGGGRWLSAYRVERAVEQFLAVPVAAQRAPGSAGGVIDLDRASTGIDLGRRWANAYGSIALGVEAVRLDEWRRGYENFIGGRVGLRGRLRRDERNRVDAVDVYAAGDYRIDDDWTVSLGARRASLRFESKDRYFANGDDSGGRQDARLAWSLGAVRAFARGELYASVGRGFETPTLNERAYRPDGTSGFNRDLRAANLRSFEIGARWRTGHSDAFLSAYRVDGEDEIVPALSRGGRASFANAAGWAWSRVQRAISARTGGMRWRPAGSMRHSSMVTRSRWPAVAGSIPASSMRAIAFRAYLARMFLPNGPGVPAMRTGRVRWKPDGWARSRPTTAIPMRRVRTRALPGVDNGALGPMRVGMRLCGSTTCSIGAVRDRSSSMKPMAAISNPPRAAA